MAGHVVRGFWRVFLWLLDNRLSGMLYSGFEYGDS